MIHVVVVEDELLVRLGTKICIEDYQSHLAKRCGGDRKPEGVLCCFF